MIPSVDKLISEARELAGKDVLTAMSLANSLAAQYPDEPKVWSLRAHMHARSGSYAEAISDWTRAIELNSSRPSTNPMLALDLLLNRGADKFALGENESAIVDFTEALHLCDQYSTDDYRETLRFWRAEALLKLGKRRQALLDLANVRDNFQFWTYKLRTKAELVADCNK